MELVFERRGAGEPLVLLHGIGSRWQVFEPMLDLLASGFEVWAVDMPGFGASPPAARPLSSIGALADEVQAWTRAKGLEGCHVAGNSTGGAVALELAARGAVASAVGLAPIGFWSARERAFCQVSVKSTRTLARLLRPVAPALLRVAPLRALLFAQFAAHPARIPPAEALADTDALIGAASFDDVCAAFTGYLAPANAADRVPVTIAWGNKDRLLLPRQLERARRRLPRARHVLISGAGHLMMRDDPHVVANVVRETAMEGAMGTDDDRSREGFVPEDFAVPVGLSTPVFRLVPLGPEHNLADHGAWSTSIEHIWATPGFAGRDWPPAEGMTLEENRGDLERHARDFAARTGFTYTVLAPATDDVLGCVYIYPSRDEDHDADVRSWVRASAPELDRELHAAVSRWLAEAWPFAAVSYADRA